MDDEGAHRGDDDGQDERRRARGRWGSIGLAAGLALLGAWTFTGLPVRNEITAFVPVSEDARRAELARQVIDSSLSRTMVVAVRGRDEAESISAAHALATGARAIEGIERVQSGPPSGIEAALYELYFPRRYAFFADTAEDARDATTDEALRASARHLRDELTGPAAMLVRRAAPEDPLLGFASMLRRLSGAAEGGPRLVDGHFVSADGFALVLLTTTASPFSSARSAPVLSALACAMRQVNQSHGGGLRFEQAGLHRFALRAEQGIRDDIQRISTLSTVGMIVLFLALYRRPRFLLLGAVPLAAGTVVATAACRLVFGGVHGVTLAFGSSLLGVGIDYVAHFVNHVVLDAERRGPFASMRALWPGLALGAATTIAGLAGLGWTGFPGMQELALFAAVGVTTSLLATRWMVPPWMPATVTTPRLARGAADLCLRVWDALRARRTPMLALGAAALLFALVGLARLRWVDDLRAMNDADPAMMAEEEAVRARVAQGEAGRFVIARGQSDDEALTRNDAVYARLTQARQDGLLRAFRSAHPFLRAAAAQRAVEQALVEAPGLAERATRALEGEGFVGPMFAPFAASLRPSEPLTWARLSDSPAGELVRPLRVELGDSIAYLTFVSGVRGSDELRARLEGIEGVDYFDQQEFLADSYRTFRRRTTELLGLGLVVVLGLCVLRYRSLRLGWASITPALLGAAVALGTLGMLGEPANLMHLVGSLLVLSMGEDYAVFLLEARGDAREVASTMVGIAVACLTTVLSFGLLATSAHPALHALGLVTSIGVASSLFLAPLALLLAPARTAAP